MRLAELSGDYLKANLGGFAACFSRPRPLQTGVPVLLRQFAVCFWGASVWHGVSLIPPVAATSLNIRFGQGSGNRHPVLGRYVRAGFSPWGANPFFDNRSNMTRSTEDPKALRARAAHFRELVAYITDAPARRGILELAERYEALAAELDATSGRGEKHRGHSPR